MYPLREIISMQEFGLCSSLQIFIGIIDLTHFHHDDDIPYRISSKGNRTAWPTTQLR